MNINSLKYYIRVDARGNKIAGSGVWRQKQPKIGRWVSEYVATCCAPTTSTSTSSTTTTTTTIP